MYTRLLNLVDNHCLQCYSGLTNTTSVISKRDTFSQFLSLIILLSVLPSNSLFQALKV